MEPTTPTQGNPYPDGWESDRFLVKQFCGRVLDHFDSPTTPGADESDQITSQRTTPPGWYDLRPQSIALAREIGGVSETLEFDTELVKVSENLASLRNGIISRQATKTGTDLRSVELSLVQSTFERIYTKLKAGSDDDDDWEERVADIELLLGAVNSYFSVTEPSAEEL